MTLTRTLNFICKFPSSHNASIIFFHSLYLYVAIKAVREEAKAAKNASVLLCACYFTELQIISVYSFYFFQFFCRRQIRTYFNVFMYVYPMHIHMWMWEADSFCKNTLSESNFLLFKKLSFRIHKS